jgi:hypothetical protein
MPRGATGLPVRRAVLGFAAAALVAMLGCPPPAPQVPTAALPDAASEPEAASEPAPPPTPIPPVPPPVPGIPAEPEPEPATAASEDDPLAMLVDPDGNMRVVVREARGARTYLLLEQDVALAGWAATEREPDPEAFVDAFDSLAGRCVAGSRAFDCLVEIAPNLGVLADTVIDRGYGWWVAALEGERVVASRSLVALSLHDLRDPVTIPPRLAVDDVDRDGKDELVIEVPVRPLRDDSLFVDGIAEDGAVEYVLDEHLATEARFTSSWSTLSRQDDPESDGTDPGETCGTVDDFDDTGTLTLTTTCTSDGVERVLLCPYDARHDRYDFPAGAPRQLFLPAESPGRHFVGETAAEVARQLPRLGARLPEVREAAADLAASPPTGGPDDE